eukprot:9669417-Alexandrium_andersonii.AAC.1
MEGSPDAHADAFARACRQFIPPRSGFQLGQLAPSNAAQAFASAREIDRGPDARLQSDLAFAAIQPARWPAR